LKLGIHLDILQVLEGAISQEELNAALRVYVASDVYLQRCKEGRPRLGLDGKPAGVVTAEEAQHAKVRLAARRRRWEARRLGHVAKTTPESSSPVETAPIEPSEPAKIETPVPEKRAGLADLREATRRRKEAASEAKTADSAVAS
jgi:sRNA-binding protein